MQFSVQQDREPSKVQDMLHESLLLQRVRMRGAGWQDARGALLDRHRSAVYRRCLFHLGDVQDAEDAVQETMLRALQGIDGFEGRSGLRTWLFAIAGNECNSLIQRRKRHQHSEHLCCLIRIHEEQQRMFSTFDLDEVQLVREALTRLPPKAREVLAMRFFSEASLEEIARTLGIGLSAAKMRLYRALEFFEANYLEVLVIDDRGARPVRAAARAAPGKSFSTG